MEQAMSFKYYLTFCLIFQMPIFAASVSVKSAPLEAVGIIHCLSSDSKKQRLELDATWLQESGFIQRAYSENNGGRTKEAAIQLPLKFQEMEKIIRLCMRSQGGAQVKIEMMDLAGSNNDAEDDLVELVKTIEKLLKFWKSVKAMEMRKLEPILRDSIFDLLKRDLILTSFLQDPRFLEALPKGIKELSFQLSKEDQQFLRTQLRMVIKSKKTPQCIDVSGNYAVTCGTQKNRATFVVWDIKKCIEERRVETQYPVHTVQFYNGNKIIAWSEKTIELYDLLGSTNCTPLPLQNLLEGINKVTSVAYGAKQNKLAIAADEKIFMVDLTAPYHYKTLKAPTSEKTDKKEKSKKRADSVVLFADEDRSVVEVRLSGELTFYRLDSDTAIEKNLEDVISYFYVNGSNLVTIVSKSKACNWDCRDGSPLGEGREDQVFVPRGQLVEVTKDKTMIFCDISGKEFMKTYEFLTGNRMKNAIQVKNGLSTVIPDSSLGEVTSFYMSPDGAFFIGISKKGFHIWPYNSESIMEFLSSEMSLDVWLCMQLLINQLRSGKMSLKDTAFLQQPHIVDIIKDLSLDLLTPLLNLFPGFRKAVGSEYNSFVDEVSYEASEDVDYIPAAASANRVQATSADSPLGQPRSFDRRNSLKRTALSGEEASSRVGATSSGSPQTQPRKSSLRQAAHVGEGLSSQNGKAAVTSSDSPATQSRGLSRPSSLKQINQAGQKTATSDGDDPLVSHDASAKTDKGVEVTSKDNSFDKPKRYSSQQSSPRPLSDSNGGSSAVSTSKGSLATSSSTESRLRNSPVVAARLHAVQVAAVKAGWKGSSSSTNVGATSSTIQTTSLSTEIASTSKEPIVKNDVPKRTASTPPISTNVLTASSSLAVPATEKTPKDPSVPSMFGTLSKSTSALQRSSSSISPQDTSELFQAIESGLALHRERNDQDAEESLLTKASKVQNALSAYLLGELCVRGYCGIFDPAAAVKHFERAMQSNINPNFKAAALCRHGELYYYGLGVKRSQRWILDLDTKKPAGSTGPEIFFLLRDDDAEGSKAELSEVLKLICKDMAKKDALYSLLQGRILLATATSEAHYKEVAKLFTKAADSEDFFLKAEAYYRLGLLNERHLKSAAKAQGYLEKAATQDDNLWIKALAELQLGHRCRDRKNKEGTAQAKVHYKKVMTQEHHMIAKAEAEFQYNLLPKEDDAQDLANLAVDSCFNLAMQYYNGTDPSVPINLQRAYTYFQRVAQESTVGAQLDESWFRLALMAKKGGSGLKRNTKFAMACCEQLRQRGHDGKYRHRALLMLSVQALRDKEIAHAKELIAEAIKLDHDPECQREARMLRDEKLSTLEKKEGQESGSEGNDSE